MSFAPALLQLEGLRSSGAARWHLFADLYLADPWFLGLVPAGLLLVAWGRGGRGRVAGRVPALIAGAPRSLAQRLAWLPTALACLAVCAVAAALARPVRADVLSSSTSEGIDIALVVDRSGSMRFRDLEQGRTRLEVVKEVVGDFAVRRMTDAIGAADSCALITFAQYPQLLCPFTLDAGALTGFLHGVELVRHEVEDGTAIGRGLAKAVALLSESDAKSRVVVLLTDGENNVGDIPPLEAARLASELGVRVYTVLAGRFVYQEDIFGREHATERALDSTELEEIARLTGGRFFRARDREALEQVYAEIETLERTPRSEERYTQTYDLYPPFLVAALILYVSAWLSYATWARRLP